MSLELAINENPIAMSRQAFHALSDLVTRQLGIKMPDAKRPMLQSRLARRMRHLGLSSLDEYYEYLCEAPGREQEMVHFFDAITTNKTDFFREPQHFDHLVERALPSLDPGAGRFWTARIWSAGCSSGEEAYTLGMVLSEFGERRGAFDFTLHATDISQRVLEAGRAAIYRDSLIAPIPEALRKKYLLRSRNSEEHLVRIGPELRRRTHFERLNLMSESYDAPTGFDAIFFRNVMIYFDKETQARVVRRLSRHLRPGGYLFIGHSESLSGLDIPLQLAGCAIYRKDPAP